MEKTRIRHLRFIAFGALTIGAIILIPKLIRSEPSSEDARSVIVDVEVPVLEGNTADARQASQDEAFKKAVEQSIPSGIESATKAKILKSPGQYVKTFRILEEAQEGDLLKLKYRVDLSFPSTPARSQESSSAPATLSDSSGQRSVPSDGLQFEITWKPEEASVSLVELSELLNSNIGAKPKTFHLSRGVINFSILSKKSEDEIKALLTQSFAGRASVNVVAQKPANAGSNLNPPEKLNGSVQTPPVNSTPNGQGEPLPSLLPEIPSAPTDVVPVPSPTSIPPLNGAGKIQP